MEEKVGSYTSRQERLKEEKNNTRCASAADQSCQLFVRESCLCVSFVSRSVRRNLRIRRRETTITEKWKRANTGKEERSILVLRIGSIVTPWGGKGATSYEKRFSNRFPLPNKTKNFEQLS